MNKYLVSILTLVTVLGGSISPALADDGGGIRDFFRKFRSEREDDREEFKQERQDNREAVQDELDSRSQELRLKLQRKQNEERQERLIKFWTKAGDRLEHLTGRVGRMSSKIAARITRLEDAGKDVRTQKELLAVADAKIDDAQEVLNDAKSELTRMKDDGASVAELIARARELHKNVVQAVRRAHAALVDVIVSMRGMSLTPAPQPTNS